MMAAPKHLFTVVIASRCDEDRAPLLKRACASVRAMAGDLGHSILVVANGPRVSDSVLDWLAQQSEIRVVRLRSGSYPLARRVGAEMADSEFLAFLDDDDELLPETLAPKLAYFRDHPDVDVLVTDGFRISEGRATTILPGPGERGTDLVQTLMRSGWGAAAITLRAKRIDLAAFDPGVRYLEWTLTVMLLARHYRFGFLDHPTYRYYEDTPNSLSKEPAYAVAAAEAWPHIVAAYRGTPHEAAVRRRHAQLCHFAAREYLRRGAWVDAWRLHLASLPNSNEKLRYLRFTARLLLSALVPQAAGGVNPGSTGSAK